MNNPAFQLRRARTLLLLVLPMMAGGATLPQHQGQSIGPTIQQASADATACIAATKAKYPSLHRMAGMPSMAQLTDETRPTPEQARLSAVRHDIFDQCPTVSWRRCLSVTP